MKMARKYSDQDLIEGIRLQDRRVLLFMYVEYFDKVKGYVLSNSGNEKDAEDLFQELLVFIYEKIRSGNFVLTCAFYTYLYSVMRNMWGNILKRKKLTNRNIEYMEVAHLSDDQEGQLQSIEKAEKETVFYKHFKELSSDCKKILLYFIEGLSIRTITEKMGYQSEQHTKNRRYRCKVSLFLRIKADPRYKELYNETGYISDNEVPRW